MRSVGHNKALGLWMNGHRVGTWRVEAGSDVLQYDDAWVRDVALRRPLSLSLPFTPGNGPHKGEAVRFYFQNLLPDNEQILERIARRYKVGATDPNALLQKLAETALAPCRSCPLVRRPRRTGDAVRGAERGGRGAPGSRRGEPDAVWRWRSG
ncbi:HipA N-terminal domain-containing protein [Comamonas sp. JC664]|uniref:HipA N-terminal domain-containing protein n=1 Tax=Comamonas sp. JC664 TaxID=2801917 RepID=UPI0036097E74